MKSTRAELPRRVRALAERARLMKDSRPREERALLVTEAYRRTEGEPAALRQAKALRHLLHNCSIGVPEGDLLAGLQQRWVKVHEGLSDELKWTSQISWPEWRGIDIRGCPQLVAERLKPAVEYWSKVKLPAARFWEMVGGAARKAMALGALQAGGFVFGHCIPDFPTVLREGLVGVIDRARQRLNAVQALDGQREFLQAVIIACQGAIDYSQRHAELAEDLSRREVGRRRRELQRIAAICRKVPAHPAETFHEALQSVWFVHAVQEEEMGGPQPTANSFGRLDQYLWPYLQSDVVAGRIEIQEARELLGCFWAKLYRLYDDQHVMVGGLTPHGDDGTNELSRMVLELTRAMGLARAVGVRVHSGSPQGFLELAASVAAKGMGVPAFFNDEVIVPALVEHGIPVDDARDYAVVGCVETQIPGRSDARTMGHSINLAKCVELAMNDGRCLLTGERIGPATGRLEEFGCYAQLQEAIHAQLAHLVELAIGVNWLAEEFQPRWLPLPFLSALTEGCIEAARDISAGGARIRFCGVNIGNLADAADSLAAVRRLVFEDKQVRADELMDALRNNFQGQEALRQLLITRGPKYACGDQEADELARWLVDCYCELVSHYKTKCGAPYLPLLFGTSPANVYHFGLRTGALPNGRRAGDPLAMSVCPSAMRPGNGSTAELMSVAALPHWRAPGGVSYILELSPAALPKSEIGRTLASLIRGFFAAGGSSIAMNVLDAQTLREAQRHPERYRWLTVRLFGYSHRFAELSRELQEYVIARCDAASTV